MRSSRALADSIFNKIGIPTLTDKAINDWLPLPYEWKMKGYHEPTLECKKKAIEVFRHLDKEHKVSMFHASPAIEGGVALFYAHEIGRERRTLIIHILNDLTIFTFVNASSLSRCMPPANIEGFDFSEAVDVFTGGKG